MIRALLPINSYWSFTKEKGKEVGERKGDLGAGNFDQTLPLGDRFGFLTYNAVQIKRTLNPLNHGKVSAH